MLSPQALIRGVVSRLLPGLNTDSQANDVAIRLGRYGEAYDLPLVRKAHLLADEGTYFVANNGQTGLGFNTYPSAFSAQNPFAIVFNSDSVGGKRIYLDYLQLVTTAAGSGTVTAGNVQIAVLVDTGNRFSSGMTLLTPASPNMDISAVASVAKVYAGTSTASPATAATGAVRTIVGLRNLRPMVSTTVIGVVGDQAQLNFGGVEGAINGNIVVANANNLPQALPPVIVGPQQSALVYVWFTAMTGPTGWQAAPELAWWER